MPAPSTVFKYFYFIPSLKHPLVPHNCIIYLHARLNVNI